MALGNYRGCDLKDFHPGGSNVARVVSIVSCASSGPTNLKKHIQRVIIRKITETAFDSETAKTQVLLQPPMQLSSGWLWKSHSSVKKAESLLPASSPRLC